MRTPLVPFLTAGLAEAWLSTRVGGPGAGILAWMAASTLWTALAYARGAPGMLGKARWPRLAPVLLAPVTLGAATASLVVRLAWLVTPTTEATVLRLMLLLDVIPPIGDRKSVV